MKTSSAAVHIFVLSLFVVVMTFGSTSGRMIRRTTRHYAGELPPGYSVSVFLEICQLCGQFYGMDYSANCVHDKTFRTFALCLSSVEKR